MRKIAFCLSSVLFLGFLIFESRGLIFPPPLKLISPPSDFITANPNVLLAGQTSPGARLQVNGTELLPNEQGYFQENLVLQKGLNVLEIKATKRYARSRVVKRKILVNEEQTQTLSKK